MINSAFVLYLSEDLEIDEEPPPPPSAVAGMDIESPSPEQSMEDGEIPEQEEPISAIDEAEETPEQEDTVELGEEEEEGEGEEEGRADDEEGKSEADISEMEPEP